MVERLEQIIRHMQLPGSKGSASPPVFIVGSFARRVTIYSQQVRATNLVYALLRTGRLNPDDRVVAEDVADGLALAEDHLPRGGGEEVEVEFDCAELHRAIALVEQQHDVRRCGDTVARHLEDNEA